MKAKELKNLGKEELESLLKEDREKLLELRMKSYQTHLKNVKEIKTIKKNIARIMTLLK